MTPPATRSRSTPPRRHGLLRRARRWRAPNQSRGLISERARRRPLGRLGVGLLFLALLAVSLSSIFPLYWLFTSSVKTPLEIIQFPPTLWPTVLDWSSYGVAWGALDFAKYFANTVVMVGGSVIFRLVVCIMAAYSLSRLKPPFANGILFLIALVLMIPATTYFVPQFVTVTDVPILHISLINTWWGVWVPNISAPVIIFLFKNFFDQIPDELFEAAIVDGAGSWKVLTRIVVPLSRPVIAVAAIVTIIGVWQEFLWPLIVLPDENLWPLEVALYRIRADDIPLNVQMAGMVIATIPMIAVFLIFQRHIVRGVALHGGK